MSIVYLYIYSYWYTGDDNKKAERKPEARNGKKGGYIYILFKARAVWFDQGNDLLMCIWRKLLLAH